MPLVTKQFPGGERMREREESRAPSIATSQHNGEYDDFEESEEDNEMNNGSLNETRPKEMQSPNVPQRSELRASRIFEKLTIELKSMKQSPLDDTKQPLEVSDPHELYLSSEEDASETADDYDESIVELDTDRVPFSRSSSRNSQEDTARVVSFIFVGKPQLIDIFSHDDTSINSQRPVEKPARRPPPLLLRSSTTSTRSSSIGSAISNYIRPNSIPKPVYSHSVTRSDVSTAAMSQCSFLESDSYPPMEVRELHAPLSSTESSAHIPRTPTSLANSAWKSGLKGLSRAKSLAKRKPSLGKISFDYASGGVKSSSTSLALPPSSSPVSAKRDTGVDAKLIAEMSIAATRPSYDRGPIRYEDIIRNAIRAPPTPSSPKTLKVKASILGVGRRKSVKAGIA